MAALKDQGPGLDDPDAEIEADQDGALGTRRGLTRRKIRQGPPMSALSLPETCDVAFKEWAGVCEALAQGRQSVILRKGGIAEGPTGFVPEHTVFWLYPTRVHEAEQGLRDWQSSPPAAVATPPGTVPLRSLAIVTVIGFLDRPELLPALGDLHVWTEATIAKRFHYRRPGLWVLGVRIYHRPEPIPLAVTAAHAGCKTWVPLDPPVSTSGVLPVLDEVEFARRMDRLRGALGLDR